jgi:hypothetical protein
MALLAIISILLITLPHRTLNTVSLINVALMMLVGVISFFIFLREPNPKNRPIFFNFAVFFLASIFSVLSTLVGKAVFVSEPFASFYIYQYFGVGFHFFLLAFAVLYVVFDTLFNEFKTLGKYLLTFLVVGGTFAYYYHPIFENPKYVYTTADIIDFKEVDAAVRQLKAEGNENPTPAQIAEIASLHAWNDNKKVGMLFEDQEAIRVAELLPYLEGSNFLTLLYRPLHLNAIYLNVLCVFFILVFFGYQYKNDPPQGAYIEKIIFLFLPYSSLEILHYYAYIKSVEYAGYLSIYSVGQYLTIVTLLWLLLFFGLRLKFISSVKGEFYERELVSDSEHISRWRDIFDSLVVRHFLNPKALHGRFFTPRSARRET